MKRFIAAGVVGLLVTIAVLAQETGWRQTPFGPAWLGPGPMPSLPTSIAPAAVPVPAPFVPSFEKDIAVTVLGNVTASANEWYFADASTAAEICKRLNCAYVFLQDAGGAGGPVTYSKQERWAAFRDGTPSQNAGLLAAYFTRNPEDKFPGVALSLINAVLAPQRTKQAVFSIEGAKQLAITREK